jgi:trans-aconitate 2-methyltransferase
MPPREWNAASYDRMSDPQLAMARDVMDRLDLRGDERVLDAGCGTGRVTEELLARVPNGTLIAVDGSQAMVDQTRERLGDRVEAFAVDLVELEVTKRFDAILSTATFHWIADHERLFARLAAALRPGGKLVAQCGGAGNIARTLRAADEVAARPAYAASLAEMPEAWLFADHHATVDRLDRAGFTETRAWLEDAPAHFPDAEAGAEFLATVVLRHHLERLDPERRAPFAREVAALCMLPDGRMEIDYVRLNLEARREEG